MSSKITNEFIQARLAEMEKHLFDENLEEDKKKKKKGSLPCSSMTITTGNIQTNIDHFNTAMGTDFSKEEKAAKEAAEEAAEEVAGGETTNSSENSTNSSGESTNSSENSAGDAGDAGAAGGEGSLGESITKVVATSKYGGDRVLFPSMARVVGAEDATVEIPRGLHVIPQNEVSRAISKLKPKDPITVSYIRVVYFYKELWEFFKLLKVTTFDGYSAMDWREVRADAGNDEADRLATSADQMAHPEVEKNRFVKRIDNRLPAEYDQINKTTNNNFVDKKGVEVNNKNLLYYPEVGSFPRVKYYLDVNDGNGYVEISRDLLEETIIAYVENLIKNGLPKSQRWSTPGLRDKLRKVLDTDQETQATKALAKQRLWEPTAKNDDNPAAMADKTQVRQMGIGQFLYFKTPYDTLGKQITEALDSSISEAKREVRRYYIRPQNIFCANKQEILKALVELEDENCSIYSLKSLTDHDKDVTKLTNKDIIYYYDDGILYDKNHVRIMDYDLFIKHEEDRKKFPGDVDDVPETTFKQEYEDRLTDQTILETASLTEATDEPRRPAVIDEEIKALEEKIAKAHAHLEDCQTRIAEYEAKQAATNDQKVKNTLSNKIRDAEKEIDNTNNRIVGYNNQITVLQEERRAYFRLKAEKELEGALGKDGDDKETPPKVVTKAYTDIVEFLLGKDASISLESASNKVNTLKWLLPDLKDNQIKVIDSNRKTSGGYPMKFGISGYIRVPDVEGVPSSYASYFNNNQITSISKVIAILRSNFEELEPLIITHKNDIEESLFKLDFPDVNAYGEILTEGKEEEICCICGEPIEGYGNNPAPVKDEGRCCDACNIKFVIPARLAELNKEEK